MIGIGTSLSAIQNRLRMQMNWAHSRYNNPANVDTFAGIAGEDDFSLFSPGVTTGTAWSHRLNWDAWFGSLGEHPSSISVEVAAEQATPLFRSVQGTATADRRQWSGAVNANLGPATVRLDTMRFRNNLDNLISIHTLQESIHTASLNIDLERLRGSTAQYYEETEHGKDYDGFSDSKARMLIPSNIALSAQLQDVRTLNGEDIILAPVIDGFDFMNQTTETIGISATWVNDQHSTTVESSYSFLDIDQRERALADRRDVHYGILHSFHSEQWSVSARVGFTRTNDLDPASRSDTMLGDWGVSASYLANNGLRFGISLDNSRSSYTEQLLGSTSLSRSKRYSVSVDVGEWYANHFSLTNTPSISVSLQRIDNTENGLFYSGANSMTSGTINIGVNF